jgi:hypothetical protein
MPLDRLLPVPEYLARPNHPSISGHVGQAGFGLAWLAPMRVQPQVHALGIGTEGLQGRAVENTVCSFGGLQEC